jgi:TRAP transporter 4TM/12TM fusion protein
MAEKIRRPATEQELQEMVAAADTGARDPGGLVGAVLAGVAIAWSLFQVWYASPLPFELGFLILNDTEARAIHLAFAVFLAFTAYPAYRRAPRRSVPFYDWALAAAGAFCAGYLFWFYRELSTRPGQPTALDMACALVGIVLLLEATRRSLGLPLVIIALAFIFYTFAGPFMPDVIQHRGASLVKFVNHQWLTTEGVFGVSLGVSTSFVFLFVLFGSLLDKAGAGNWMMQVSVALLGHLRGGPAKVAVVSSALNGVVSGSSISNVVSGGIFTIPMMKRTGLSGVKAGAIETASSINGQIMPPVMGAAAFLMAEFVGISYAQIVKHAALPAIISYLALLYIVHLEAVKLGMKPLTRETPRPARERFLRLGIGISGTVVVLCAIYYAIIGAQQAFGESAGWVLAGAGMAVYGGILWYASKFPDLKMEDPNAPIIHLPEAWETVRTGLHFLIPLVVLLWCLMVDQLSPGLSAFWATVAIAAVLATQRPLLALFRRGDVAAAAVQGLIELRDGLKIGARSMVGIAAATAAAGIVVGTITLTGMGLMMTELVELISGGNVVAMLLLTAGISLILGMGIPTTANYILVATLMAPVIVELGAQGGLLIPLIAVHMFVFYFGIMADVTPPVGLASFAAAAISGEDPIATGFQGSFYALRTAILPFVFIYNPQLLLIGLGGWGETILVITASTAAILLFSAVTMNFFVVRSRWYETAALALASFTLFHPGYWLDFAYPPLKELPPSQLFAYVNTLPEDGRVGMVIEGINLEGEDVTKTVSLPLGAGADAKARIEAAGLRLSGPVNEPVIGSVGFGSAAKRVGFEQGFKVVSLKVPNERPSPQWLLIPAFALAVAVYLLQLRRKAAPAYA